MTKPEPDFGRDELLSTLTDMLQPEEGKRGLTTSEICQQLNAPLKKVRSLLRQLHEQDRLEREVVYEEGYDGVMRQKKAYRVLSNGKPD